MAAKKKAGRSTTVTTYPPSNPPTDFEQAGEQRRIKDVASAQTIYDRLVMDNQLRSSTFSRVRNQLEGGLPYDPASLEAQGAAWQTNVNFRDAEAARDRTLLPYWKLVNDVPYRVAVTIDSKAPQSEQWQVAFAEAFDRFHDDWGAAYQIEFMNLCSNYVNFGPGIAQWCDPDSPRYEAVNVQRIYFPKNTRMVPDSWEVVALVQTMSCTEIYDKVRNKKKSETSRYAGWNVDALKQCIVQLSQAGGQMPDYRDYTYIQDQLVNNDIAVSTPFQPVDVVWLYVKQFDGKIAAYAFTRQGGVNDFLFEDQEYAESFRHLLGSIWYTTGTDSMVHSIKGFGIKNYYFSSLSNRMKSRFYDAGAMSLSVNFQYDSENHPDEAPPIENYGPFTFFPDGVKQLTVYPDIQRAAIVLESLANNQAENNSLYRQSQNQIEQSDTATQAKILASMQGQLTEASASLYLAQLGENIFTEQIRRLRKKGSPDEDAKKFQRRLKDKGVPDEIIFDADVYVKAGANAGMANPSLAAMKYQQGLALANTPGVNARWFLENYIAFTYGANAVSKALIPEGQQSAPTQRRQAIMENADFGQGIQLPVAPEDAHSEHIEEHLRPLIAIAQQAQQNASNPGNPGQGLAVSPEQLSALTIGIEHTGQHMQFLEQDESKKDQFRQFLPVFRQVQNIAKKMLMQAQAQQQQGMASQGPAPAMQMG